MSNHTTLAQLDQMTVGDVATLPIDHLALLLETVADEKSRIKRLDDKLNTAMWLRFSDAAALARREKGTDTGTVRVTDGDYTILADLPKKVAWDTDGLRQVAQQLEATGEPVSDYIQIRMDVSERAYIGWPQSLKKMFDPHRTVSAGRATFKIEKRESV